MTEPSVSEMKVWLGRQRGPARKQDPPTGSGMMAFVIPEQAMKPSENGQGGYEYMRRQLAFLCLLRIGLTTWHVRRASELRARRLGV